LITINHDNQFNIYVHLNIPTDNFLHNFRIPSLKDCLPDFTKWFETFFKIYSRQFHEINKEKTFNYLKYHIAQTFAINCKLNLPMTFEIENPTSIQDRIHQTYKAALHHIHLCSSTEDDPCTLIPLGTTHNLKNLNSYFFKKSFELFPPVKREWIYPPFNHSIFDKNQTHYASFSKSTPLNFLRSLANEQETKFCELNSVTTNTKRTNFFFYTIFKIYQQAAATNDGILDLEQNQAIDKIAQTPVDTHFLARVITHYQIQQNLKITIPKILELYKTRIFPQAEKILTEKFRINFENPIQLQDSLFFDNSTQHLEKQVDSDSDLYADLETTNEILNQKNENLQKTGTSQFFQQ
jgi:hypothetical protein